MKTLLLILSLLIGSASVEKIGPGNWTLKYSVGLGLGSGVFWVVLYTVWRAQAYPRKVWRAIAFIGGLPVTLLSYFAVTEGSDRAYGIELPRQKRS